MPRLCLVANYRDRQIGLSLQALMSFKGCVVIVSHDRYFLNRVCNGILAFEGNGSLHFSEGNYDYYIEKRNLRFKDLSAPIEKEKKPDARVKVKTKKLSWKDQKELDSIEEEILKAEQEVERIEQLFLLPDFYKIYATQINQLNSELESAKKKVSYLYERWGILEELSGNS